MIRFLNKLVDDSKLGALQIKNRKVWSGARKLVGMVVFGVKCR